jgi:hypothetical protein
MKCLGDKKELVPLKDRLGDQRGGSEWESIKILLQRENSAYAPDSQPRIPTRVCQGRVVTMDLSTLGANPNRSQSESETQRAKDLAAQHWTRRTVRKHRADRPRGLGGLSAWLQRTVRKEPPNLQYWTLHNGPSVMGPRTVRLVTDHPTL